MKIYGFCNCKATVTVVVGGSGIIVIFTIAMHCCTVHTYGQQYWLWSFKVKDKNCNRLLSQSEVFQKILWYILKWIDGEPAKFGPIKKNFLNMTHMKSANNEKYTSSD